MLIGLTGGIASGKSTSIELLRHLGIFCADADEIVKKNYRENKTVQQKLSDRWGSKIFHEQQLDYNKIASIVFQDAEELNWLNSIIHPIVKQEISFLVQNHSPIVIAIPLLYENNWQDFFDKIICVWTNPKKQQEFIKHRNWDNKELERRRQFQWHQNKKLELADYAIINTGDKTKLKEQISKLARDILF